MTDRARIHGNLRAIIEIGEPIDVPIDRERGTSDGDPLMNTIRERLEEALARLQHESTMYASTK